MQTFGTQVKRARERAELTQVALATKAKIDPGTVARIERDEQRPTKRVRRVLARVLGISAEGGA